jgi:phage terminase large subunit-like protein
MKFTLLLAAVVAVIVRADTSNHRYKKSEHVELWVNKVSAYLFSNKDTNYLDPSVVYWLSWS